MSETEFWSSLEFRICHELAGMTETGLNKLWCDGIGPEAYLLTDMRPRILGHAWICEDRQQQDWRFELLLSNPVASRDEISWKSLLPPENVTRWLAVEKRKKFLQIEPSAAVSDL
jgi:hypothetical protein